MLAFVALCVLIWIGHLLRVWVKPLRWLYLPSSVIAGIVGLIVLQLFGQHLPAAWTAGWSKIPGLMINVVFACLFLGVKIPNIKSIWRHAGPQLAYGQMVAWGQYVVGVGLVLLFLGKAFSLPDMFGGIIPVGFEGGHGTAGGMGPTFEELGWKAGRDFGLASATVGMIAAIVVGMGLINWAIRKGHVQHKKNSPSPADVVEDYTFGVIPVDQRPPAGRLSVSADVIETFTLNLVFVGIAVGIGYLIKGGMTMFEQAVNADIIAQAQKGVQEAVEAHKGSNLRIFTSSFPTFPLCMIGGLMVQLWSQHFDKNQLMDPGLTRRIQNTSLDILVVPAIAMINIQMIKSQIVPFSIIVLFGILWNVFCVLFLARRILPDAWFERSIAEMGQSMGVTSTGLLLLRVVDPDYKTPAAESFAYKQILHEPFMGGGIWTSAAIPLLAIYGGWYVFGIACGAMALWLGVTFLTPFIRAKK